MHADLASLQRFLELMHEHRPCPTCGSDRVTVRALAEKGGHVLRAECSDCGRTYDAPRTRD